MPRFGKLGYLGFAQAVKDCGNVDRIVAIVQGVAPPIWPGKLVGDLAGKPILWRILERVARCAVNEVVVALGAGPGEDDAATVANDFGVRCYRGDDRDLLQRYVGAAHFAAADVIVRVTANCPLFDSGVANRTIAELTSHLSSCDYASNVVERTFPRGLEVEVFTFGALTWLDRLSRNAEEREQVTTLARGRLQHQFSCRSVKDEQDHSDLRWTLDRPEDAEWARWLYRELDLASHAAEYREIVAHVRKQEEAIRTAAKRGRRAA